MAMLFGSSSNSYQTPFIFEEDLNLCNPMNTIRDSNTHQQHLGNNLSSNGFHQHDVFFDHGGHSNDRSFVSQLGLNQRQRLNNYDLGVRPQMVEIRTVINYLPVQNQTSFSLVGGLYGCETMGPVRVTEVFRTHEVARTTQEMVRIQLLDSVSTRDHFLPPGVHDYSSSWNDFSLQPTSFEPQSGIFPYHLSGIQSQPSTFQNPQACFHGSSHNFPIHGHNYQNPSYDHHHKVNIRDHNMDVPSYNHPTNLQRNRSSIRILESELHEKHEDEDIVNMVLEPNPAQNLFQDLIPEFDVQAEQVEETRVVNEVGDKNNLDDGKTRSTPYKKYGPYTCPRCKRVFITSQSFAAHMRSHYKNESALQTHMRRKAKYGINYQPGLANRARGKKDKASGSGGRKKITNVVAASLLIREHEQGEVVVGACGSSIGGRVQGFEMEGALFVAPIKEEA